MSDDNLRKVKNLKAQDQLALTQVYRKVFNTPEGQLVLHDLANKLYAVRPTHCEGDQPLDMARKEGMRQGFFLIMQVLEADTNQIIDIIKQTNKDIEKKRKQMDFVNTNDEVLIGGLDE